MGRLACKKERWRMGDICFLLLSLGRARLSCCHFVQEVSRGLASSTLGWICVMASASTGSCCTRAAVGLLGSTPDISPWQTQCAEGWVLCHDGLITKPLVMVGRDKRYEFDSWICYELHHIWQVIPPHWKCFLIYKRKSNVFTDSLLFLCLGKT